MCPKNGSGATEGSGAQVLGGVAEGGMIVCLVKKRLRGHLITLYNLPERRM